MTGAINATDCGIAHGLESQWQSVNPCAEGSATASPIAQDSLLHSTDSRAAGSAYYVFDVQGEVHGWKSGADSQFSHAGRIGYYCDPDSDLQLLRARYHGPVPGRFLARDGLGAVTPHPAAG
jgi:hypothetical protein